MKEVPTTSPWFRVFEAGEGVYAIAEPYNWQEVISYLILGRERNILFDSGMGIDSISKVVRELSGLPVLVINSHTHFDHIGGNYEFDSVLAVDTPYTRQWAERGWPHESVRSEVMSESICLRRLPDFDTSSYAVRPFAEKITGYIRDGDTIDLGDRSIEVLLVPGHTPDGVALLDRSNGYLWTGDNFYEAPIWLFFSGTDLPAYAKSVEKLAGLTEDLKSVYTAHNVAVSAPERLAELKVSLESVRNGSAVGVVVESEISDSVPVRFEFEHFEFLIRKDQLEKFRSTYR